MGTVFVCDCGKKKHLEEDELVRMGVSQQMYCKGECEERVQEFLDARDELHEKIQKIWASGMKKLYKTNDGFELPDG